MWNLSAIIISPMRTYFILLELLLYNYLAVHVYTAAYIHECHQLLQQFINHVLGVYVVFLNVKQVNFK